MARGKVLDTMRYELALDASKANAAAPGLMRIFGGISKSAIGAGAAVATIGLVAAKAVGDAAKFQTAWAEVKTILALTTEENHRLAESMHDLSTAIPKDAIELTKGFYQVISAGITDVADASEVLEVSAKAAIGGLSDTFTAVDVITSSLNAFERGAEEATDVADTLFTAVREGKLTFNTLAESIGPVIPFFAQAGLKLDELSGAMATLTKGGLNAHIAATALRSTILAILKPSEEARKTALQLGIQFDAAALKAKGFAGFLRDIKAATAGNASAITQLFPNVRSLAAVLNLAGNQADEFERIMGTMDNRVGNADRAFAIMNDTLEAQSAIMKNKLSRFWVNLGDVMLGSMQKMITAFGKSSDVFFLMKENVAGLVDESRVLEKTLIPLADEYDRLVADGVEPGTREFNRHKEIMDILVQAYPNLKREINEFGETVSISTGHLREMNAEAKRAATDEFEKAIGERSKSLEEMEKRVKNASASMNRLLQFQKESLLVAAPGQGIWSEVPESQRQTFFKGKDVFGNDLRLSAKDFNDELTRTNALLDGSKKSIHDFEADLVSLFRLKGVDQMVLRWASLRDRQDESAASAKAFRDVQLKLAVELPSMFDAVNGPAGVFAEILERTLETMRDMRGARVGLFGLDYGALPEEPPPVAFDKATKMWRDAYEDEAAQLKAYIEEQLGVAFWGKQFEKLDPIVKAFFQEQLDARIQMDDKAAQNALAEARKVHEARLKMIQKEAEERRKAALAGLQKISSDPLSSGAKGAPPVSADSSIRELMDLFVELRMETNLTNDQVEAFIADLIAVRTAGELASYTMADLEGVMADIESLDPAAAVKMLEKLQETLSTLPEGDAAAEELRRNALILVNERLKDSQTDLIASGGVAGRVVDELARSFDGFAGAFAVFAKQLLDLEKFSKEGFANSLAAGIETALISVAADQISGFFSNIFGGNAAASAAKSAELMRENAARVAEFIEELNAADLEKLKNQYAAINDVIKQAPDFNQGDFLAYVNSQLPQASMKRMEKFLADIGAITGQTWKEVLSDIMDGGLSPVVDGLEDMLDEVRRAMDEFGKILTDTWDGVLEHFQTAVDLFDIDDAAEQLDMLLKSFEEFSGVDLSALRALKGSDMERATELLAGLVTGVNAPGMTTVEMMQELAKLMGVQFSDIGQLLADLKLSGLSSPELIALLQEMERLGDAVENQTEEIGAENISVSRNVSITQQQGDTIVALMNSTMTFLRRITEAAEMMLSSIVNLPGGDGGTTEINLTATFTVTFAPDTPARTAAGELAATFVEDVETQLRGKGIKMIGQGR